MREITTMAVNEMLKIAIETQWLKEKGGDLKVAGIRAVNGGDINQCYRLETGQGVFFLKYNQGHVRDDFFKKEYDGLVRLQRIGTLGVPSPLFFGETGEGAYLLTDYIGKAAPGPEFWRVFAEGLASMHGVSHTGFGLEEHNFIGSMVQDNGFCDTWSEFYITRRLEPLIKQCLDQQMLPVSVIRNTERLYRQLPDIFPSEKPALLHGDLWGGNFLSGPGGVPFVFDPAVYYGNREMDLAMARLFGGFDRKFFWYYEEYYPLAAGWQERIPLCQLYPLLVHALLFGGGYVQQARTILSDY